MSEVSKTKQTKSAPSLRPPTLMIDLLFGALMLFAFQMGDPHAKTVVPHEINLPTEDAVAGESPKEVLALVPVKLPTGWVYEIDNGSRLSAELVKEKTKAENKVPVLLLPKSHSVQSYVDAETPLRKMGLKVGLAVTSGKGETP